MASSEEGRWGKTWRKSSPSAFRVHRVEHHCLDALAILDVILRRDAGLLSTFSAAAGMEEGQARGMLRWCVLVHDVGKLGRSFAAKSREGWGIMNPGTAHPSHHECMHDVLGYAEAGELCMEDMGAGDTQIMGVGGATFFHHGRPRPVKPGIHEGWMDLRTDRKLIDHYLASATSMVGEPSWPGKEGVRRCSWLLNGIVCLCDALGSAVSEDVMERAVDVPSSWHDGERIVDVPWEDYYATVALPAAARVVDAVGQGAFLPLLPPAPLEDSALLARMMPHRDTPVPSPIQSAALNVPMMGQFMAFIEDTTGSGKSEASAILVRRAMAGGMAAGAYWALPTMATANSLYARMQHVVGVICANPDQASLVLAHGAREENRLFQDALRGVATGASCAHWLTEGSHRSLLSHFGVGTIDQALAAGVNSYHCGLRWLGLHRKVLVVDEAHAADKPMLVLLQRVLRHHAALGGSAAIMSATLPSRERHELMSAFAAGAGWRIPPQDEVEREAYPLLSMLTSTGLLQQPVETRTDRIGAGHRMERIGSETEVSRRIVSWVSKGRCAAWFRNTVADSIEGFRLLRAAGLEPILFHSRFTRARRALIEEEVSRRFGPRSSAADRIGRVLVCTQVAEQSLDIDLDETACDLAPADSVLQRLGRRRRHVRDTAGNPALVEERPDDTALLLSPNPDEVADSAWYSRVLPRAAYVYEDHLVIWRSASLLLRPYDIPDRHPGLPHDVVMPHLDARPLVEAVYPLDVKELTASCPPPLRGARDGAQGKELASADEARLRAFDFRLTYYEEACRKSTAFEDSASMAVTRTGDGGTVHLAVEEGGQWKWLEAGGMMQSSVPLPFNPVQHATGKIAADSLLEGLRRYDPYESDDDKSRRRREERMLVKPYAPVVVALSPTGPSSWKGYVNKRDGQLCRLDYDTTLGLQHSKA